MELAHLEGIGLFERPSLADALGALGGALCGAEVRPETVSACLGEEVDSDRWGSSALIGSLDGPGRPLDGSMDCVFFLDMLVTRYDMSFCHTVDQLARHMCRLFFSTGTAGPGHRNVDFCAPNEVEHWSHRTAGHGGNRSSCARPLHSPTGPLTGLASKHQTPPEDSGLTPVDIRVHERLGSASWCQEDHVILKHFPVTA